MNQGQNRVIKICYGIITLVIIFLVNPCFAEVTNIQIVNGKCEKQSHTAEGNIGEDLTRR
jgi:hypothetical protein